jgi:hypothetical protein
MQNLPSDFDEDEFSPRVKNAGADHNQIVLRSKGARRIQYDRRQDDNAFIDGGERLSAPSLSLSRFGISSICWQLLSCSALALGRSGKS